jgi:acylglycerol lipase
MTVEPRHAAGDERIPSTGGGRLHLRTWRPGGIARGMLIIVPGFNSHSGYYTWVAEQLVSIGLVVYAVDLRGRGSSDGERFYIESFTDYVDDVSSVSQFARSREGALPLYVLGHSAGGVVACLYTLDHQTELSGLICESFAFQIPAPDFAVSVLRGLSLVAPHGHVLRLKNQDFSRDPEVVAAMNSDPLIANETQATRTVAEMVRADERLKTAFSRMTLPILILHGSADKATLPSGSQFFHDHAGSADKTLKLYDGYFHDPLNDLGKEMVMADVRSWLDARLPALRPGAAHIVGSASIKAGT